MIVCPFCGKTHDSENTYLNIACSCNAKYYANTHEWLNRNIGENKPTLVLGFYSYSNEFLIGEYYLTGGCTAEFKLVRTPMAFKAEIYDDAFKLVLNPKLEKLWNMTKNINTMREMESYLINIGLVKCN